MPKYNTGSQFDEFFMNAFQFQQSLNEKRATRTQDINFKLRQLSLLSDYYDDIDKRSQRNADLRSDEGLGRLYGQGFTDTQEGQTPDINVFDQGLTSPVIEQKQEGIERTITKNINGKPVIFGVTDSGGLIDLGEKYYQPKSDKTTTEKTPFYDLTKSGKAFNEYKGLTGSNVKSTGDEDFEVITEKGNVEFTKTELETVKGQKIKQIEETTNNEARKINSTVPGFYNSYQELLRIIPKRATKEQINNIVNKELKGMSSTTMDAMKTLLKRRIF